MGYDMEKIKLGFCPTRRDVFSKEEAQRYREIVLDSLGRYDISLVDLKGLNEEELLCRREETERIIDRFRCEKIDAVFFPHCNFGSENLVAAVAQALQVPALLWGPRDDAPDEKGIRSRDSQCGLFATGKVLRRHNVPFTYLTNSYAGSKEFHRGFRRFLAVARVVKAFKGLRILQIDTRPEPFSSVICNENELLERFNIHVLPISISEITEEMKRVRAERGEDFTDTVARIRRMDSLGTDENVENTAALKVAMKRFARYYDCRAVAIQCWSALQVVTGIMPCLANALLTDEGIPVACETDILGAVSAVMVQAAAQDVSVPFFSDITIRHPENDNAELLWHCGNFPPSLARDPDAMSIGGNPYNADHNYGIVNWELRQGDLTVIRFDGDHGEYSLLIGEAHTTEGPMNLGSYVWMETGNWKKWEHKLVEGPYIHHVAGAFGHYGEIFTEACKYIPGLRPDPVEPDMQELIERWW